MIHKRNKAGYGDCLQKIYIRDPNKNILTLCEEGVINITHSEEPVCSKGKQRITCSRRLQTFSQYTSQLLRDLDLHIQRRETHEQTDVDVTGQKILHTF